jgi:ABC-type glycerol-3-phosphate transport system substrate-binding protein
MLKSLIMVALFIAILFFVGFWKFGAYFTNEKETAPFTLTIWSTRDDEQFMQGAIKEYQKAHPYANFKVIKQSSLNYRTRVQAQIAQGNGPDIFLMHQTWSPMYLQTRTIAAMPQSLGSVDEYTKAFYPIVKDSFVNNGKLYGVAPFVDGLVLLVNEELLGERKVEPPNTWDEFFTAAQKLNAIDSEGNLTIAGAAIGTTNNIDYWSDLLGLLYLQQPETDLTNPATDKGADVIRFYTQFALPKNKLDRSWDAKMDNATKLFTNGKVAMIVSTYEKALEIKAANPALKFRAVPMPQLPTKNITWGSFWGYGVSNSSPQKEQAWTFLLFLSSVQGEKIFDQGIKAKTGHPLPYSRLDLQKEQVNDPLIGAVVTQAPLMKSWYLCFGTQDQGLNDSIITAYQGSVNATLEGKDPLTALQTTAEGVQKALSEYTTPLPPAK